MTMTLVFLAVLAGVGLMIVGMILYRRDEDAAIADLLGMAPASFRDDPDDREETLSAVVAGRAVDLAGHAVDAMDKKRSLGVVLDRAQIPLRPGEFVIVILAASLGLAAVLMLVFGQLLMAVAGMIATPLLAVRIVRRRVSKRTKKFCAQLPDALSLIASSLSAGHTFLRAVQMMCEESPPPLSEEFARLVAETRLGDNVTEALGRMAERLQIRDLDMVVQAIRIQQTVGGRLADLFHTLSDVIRARDEVKREVLVLTAEGRMSAYVLAGLVPVLFMLMRVVNPGYLEPLYSGKGLFVLIGCGLSVVAGLFVILRMVKIDV